MRRRDLLVATAALGVAPTPALAAPAVNAEAVRERVARLRIRMATAGDRTVARYRRQLAEGTTLPADLWTTIREGFGALAVVPSVRRMSPEEQALPEAQALILDVAERAGAYFLHLHDALGQLLAHPDPAHRATAGEALHRLGHHDDDEEFGRATFMTLRAERESVRGELARTGSDSILQRAFCGLDDAVAAARLHVEAEEAPVDTRPEVRSPGATAAVGVAKAIGRGLAAALGLVLLAGALAGGAIVLGAVLATVALPVCLPIWILVAVIGGVIMVVCGAAGIGLLGLGVGKPAGGGTAPPLRSRDGQRITTSAPALWAWFATGASFGETQPQVVAEGTLRVPGRLTGAGPRGYEGTAADSSAPAPGLPEFALVARVGDWVGMASGSVNAVASAPRTGELWLAVNAPAAKASSTGGSFSVTILL